MFFKAEVRIRSSLAGELGSRQDFLRRGELGPF